MVIILTPRVFMTSNEFVMVEMIDVFGESSRFGGLILCNRNEIEQNKLNK